jgi:hypothetical protein
MAWRKHAHEGENGFEIPLEGAKSSPRRTSLDTSSSFELCSRAASVSSGSVAGSSAGILEMPCLRLFSLGLAISVTACSCKSPAESDGGDCRRGESPSRGCEEADSGPVQDGGAPVYRLIKRRLGEQLIDANENGDVLVVYWQGNRRARLYPGCAEPSEEIGSEWSFSDARSINRAGSVLLRGPLQGSTFGVLRRDGGLTLLQNDIDPLKTVDATHLAENGTVVGNREWDVTGAIKGPSFLAQGLRYLRSNGTVFVLEASVDGGPSRYWVWNSETDILSALEMGQAPAAIVTGISDEQITGGLDFGDSATTAAWNADGRLRATGRNGVVLYSDAANQLVAEAEFRPEGIARRTLLFALDGGWELSFQAQPVQVLVSRPTGEFAGYCLDAGYICCSSIEVLRQGDQR